MWQNLGKTMILGSPGSRGLFFIPETQDRLFKRDSKKIGLIPSGDAISFVLGLMVNSKNSDFLSMPKTICHHGNQLAASLCLCSTSSV